MSIFLPHWRGPREKRQCAWHAAASLGALVLAACASGVSAAPARPEAPASHYTFAFDDADIAQVTSEVMGKALGLSYDVDPAVKGKMSFRIDRQLTGPQLLEAFEAALETNDVVMVRRGDSFLVEPRSKAKGAAALVSVGESRRSPGYETVVVPLDYAQPSEVAKALKSIAQTDLVLFTDDHQGLLVLGGSGQELQSAIETIHMLDKSGLEESKIRFFELAVAPAETVAADLDKVLVEASNANGVSIVPLKRLNGIFVFAKSKEALAEISGWVAKLDVPSKDKGATFWAYHPRNVTAEALGAALNGLMTGQQQQTAPHQGGTNSPSGQGASAGATQGPSPDPSLSAGGFGGLPSQAMGLMGFGGGGGPRIPGFDDDPARVSVDKESNTLLVLASPTRWVQIQKILDEIDRAPGEVFIEASVLEVTLTNQLNFGVDWSSINDRGRLVASSVNSASGAIAASVPGFSVTYLGKSLQTAVNALGQQTAVEVLSEPKILALDNHTAKLNVGDQVPIITQDGQSTNAAGSPIINSVDYKDTGIILDVTPRISADNRVSLDVDQEVSSVAQTSTSTIDSPTIQQRKFSTSLVIDDGGVVALGGLISSNKSTGDSGLPIVKDIPGLGALFKTNTNSGNRTELIVLLTAKVVRNPAESRKVMTDLVADMHEVERRGLLKP